MKKSILTLISLLFLIGCGEETIFPEGSEVLPGIYEGSITTLGSKGEDYNVNAIVGYIEKNLYTIEIIDYSYMELPIFKIKISGIEGDDWIAFDVLNENCMTWGMGPNHYFDYHATENNPHIILKFKLSCELREKNLGLFEFIGRKNC